MTDNQKKESKIKATIWVVLMDKKKQKITAGREPDQVSAAELRDACCRKLRITADGAQAFAIWICSPLLQIQLKPSHYPTALCDLWYDLIAQFAAVSEASAKSDLPVIMMMRNVFYPLGKEKELVHRDPQARYYLTAEAMFNVLTGRYPIEDELAFKLAALQLKMEGKKVSNYPSGSIQTIAQSLLPWDVIQRRKKQPLYIDKRVRENLSGLSLTTPGTLDYMYLAHSWTQACYRCAYFQGQTEVVGKRRDVPVRVGITPHNIFIWNKSTNKLLQQIPVKDISSTKYQTKTLAELDNRDVTETKLVKGKTNSSKNSNKFSFDVFVVNFTITASVKKRTTTAIPIFSKQACMMKAMFDRLKDESHLHADTTASSIDPTPIVQNQNEVDGLIDKYRDLSNPTLKIGTKEYPVSTKHISKKQNLRGLTFNKKGKLQKTKIKQTARSKYDV